MNYPFILYRVTTNLYTAVRMYDRDFTLIDMMRRDPDLDDNHVATMLIEQPLIQESNSDMPVLFSVNEDLIYAWVDSGTNYFLLGPTRFEWLQTSSDNIPIQLKNNLTFEDIDISPILDVIPPGTMQILADDAAILYNLERDIKKDFLDA